MGNVAWGFREEALVPVDDPPRQRRIPASRRREQLLAVALAMVRETGAGSLSLARVAEAGGVSKPIAYHHFGTLPGLLGELYERVCAEYETNIVARLAARPEPEDPTSALRDLSEAYVRCSLECGALRDEIGAALVTVEGTDSTRASTIDRYAGIVAGAFGLDPARSSRLALAFVGAADRLCEATIASRLSPEEAIDTLVELFAPQLTSRPSPPPWRHLTPGDPSPAR